MYPVLTARCGTAVSARLENLDGADRVALRATVQGRDRAGRTVREPRELRRTKQVRVDVALREWRRGAISGLSAAEVDTKERHGHGPGEGHDREKGKDSDGGQHVVNRTM